MGEAICNSRDENKQLRVIIITLQIVLLTEDILVKLAV